MSKYDVIVIGGGSAGTSAAAAACNAGASTALINDGELGGLCILRGCMPTKSMLAAAHVLHEARHTEPFGVTLNGTVDHDFQRIMQRKDAHVSRFKRAKIQNIESQKYEVIDGRAQFDTTGQLRVDGRPIDAARYVIATGSRPRPLPIPGRDRVPLLTSDDVMRLTQQPERLLVLGAGAIGLELAQFFARIGTQVTVLNRSAPLSRCDPDAGVELTRALREEMTLIAPAQIVCLEPHGAGLRAQLQVTNDTSGPAQVQQIEADALLVAAGREAAVDGLGLENVGLAASVAGLAHDAEMRTANPQIFVAGDATGQQQILHLANQEGAVAGHNAAGKHPPKQMDYRLAMSVIFTDPPFAEVGMSAVAAVVAGKQSDRRIAMASAKFPETGRAITMETRHGMWRLITDADSGEILGSSILGPRADDLIHLIAILMHNHNTVDDVRGLPWYHPTLSEVMLTLVASNR